MRQIGPESLDQKKRRTSEDLNHSDMMVTRRPLLLAMTLTANVYFKSVSTCCQIVRIIQSEHII